MKPERNSFQNLRVIAALALILTACGAGQQPQAAAVDDAAEVLPADLLQTAAALRDRALQESRAFDFVESLTLEVGSRFAGSPGDRQAVDWAVQKLTDLGLSNVRAEPVMVPRWIRGDERGEIVAPFRHEVVLAALGGSEGTSGWLEAEVVELGSLDEEIHRDRVAGKIVFYNQRLPRTRDGSGYGQTVGIRVNGAAKAAAKGAVAVIIRSVGTSNNRLPHTGTMRYTDDAPRIPAAALSNPDADLLARQLATGEPVRFRLWLGSRYEDDVPSANVIGEIRGREKPEEIVLLAAHLDSWDLGTGALDDGVGCAVVTETARLIGQLDTPPRRTVRVLLAANEEFGLSGARAYAERYAADFDRHLVGLESDFGAGRIWSFQTRFATDDLAIGRDLARLLEPLEIEYEPGNQAFGGADLSPLRAKGLPLIDLRHDGSEYFDYHHTANDTLDKIDPEAVRQIVAAWVATVYAVAEMEGDLGEVPEGRR